MSETRVAKEEPKRDVSTKLREKSTDELDVKTVVPAHRLKRGPKVETFIRDHQLGSRAAGDTKHRIISATVEVSRKENKEVCLKKFKNLADI